MQCWVTRFIQTVLVIYVFSRTDMNVNNVDLFAQLDYSDLGKMSEDYAIVVKLQKYYKSLQVSWTIVTSRQVETVSTFIG